MNWVFSELPRQQEELQKQQQPPSQQQTTLQIQENHFSSSAAHSPLSSSSPSTTSPLLLTSSSSSSSSSSSTGSGESGRSGGVGGGATLPDSKALIEQLKQENARLHALLALMRPRSSSAADDANRPSNEESKEPAVHPSEFVPGEHSVIFVCTSTDDESKKGAFVAVMDVNDEEWWEVIDPEKDSALKQPELIDSDYVMVEDKEVISALSKFVAGTLKGYPEAKALPPAQLKQLLDRSFSTLQEKGTLMKAYDWASFAYTSYGWASYGWALYQDPTMLRMVAKWSFNAATWAIWLL